MSETKMSETKLPETKNVTKRAADAMTRVKTSDMISPSQIFPNQTDSREPYVTFKNVSRTKYHQMRAAAVD
jgi:hypothetical protein